MITILIANQKGGIAKTTTSTALASVLTSKGYKTLLVDADPQGNSSDTYRAQIEGAATLYDVILEKETITMAEAVQKTDIGEIIASDPLLKSADQILLQQPDYIYKMKDALEELSNYTDPEDGRKYDFVVFDTGPADNAILRTCMAAADYIIIPVSADRYSLQGLSTLNDTINAIRKRINPNLRVLGLLLVKYDSRIKLDQEVMDSLVSIADKLNTRLFKTKIRKSVKAREAQARRLSLMKHARWSTTAMDYRALTDEILKEVNPNGKK